METTFRGQKILGDRRARMSIKDEINRRDQHLRGNVEDMISKLKVTRYDKIEAILEYWSEGWEGGNFGDILHELQGLHTGETALYQYDDDELDAEYENALEYFKELDEEQE